MRVKGGRVVPGMLFAGLVVVMFVGTLVGRATGNWHSSIGKGDYRKLIGSGTELPHP